MYLDGIRGNDWLLLKELYSDCSSRVKWAGELSDPINIKQGVRQGGVLSTGHYKRYNNPLLLQLEEGYSGIKIGSISIPHVTVADDLAILAGSKSENQVMVWDVEDSSNRERYCVHPAKSHILWYKLGKKDNSDLDVFLGDARVDVSASATHLGINRSTSQSVDIEGKISVFKESRQEYIQKLTDSGILPDHLTIQLQDPVFLTQLTLDCSKCVDIRAWDSNKFGLLELYSREYIYAVHMKRLRALMTISGN